MIVAWLPWLFFHLANLSKRVAWDTLNVDAGFAFLSLLNLVKKALNVNLVQKRIKNRPWDKKSNP